MAARRDRGRGRVGVDAPAPPGSNDAYRGAPVAWWLLLALAVLNFGRGGIHLFADDAGAARIAGTTSAEAAT